jgi:acyl-CoA thioester hydrolase
MGVVYHSNYLIWFEVGRVELMRHLGGSYRQMESEEDCHLPVVEARCRYKAPARFDEEIIVRAHIARLGRNLVEFGYQVLRAADRLLLAEGETTHLAVDGSGRRRPLPDRYFAVFQAAHGHLPRSG